MNWPKGKYNGAKIGGFLIRLEINIWWWRWKVYTGPFQPLSLHLGPLHFWLETSYER